MAILTRIPVVAGLAYIESIRKLPPTFTATLTPEPDNRYFRHAIIVSVRGEKVGYVAPEVAAGVFEQVKEAEPRLTCPGRRATRADHDSSGVELLLDFSGLPLHRDP
ncbi:hypothetical protein BH24ACI5_BH24ACI5_02750 [soil metagenome]